MHSWFETTIRARSYELDGFGHLNHTVYLNYFEEARVRTLEEAGHPFEEILEQGRGVHVVRLEADYRREAFLGDVLRIRTRVDEVRRTSMAVVQQAMRDGDEGPELICEARVTWVWVGSDGRPMRVPGEVREALVAGPSPA